MGAITTFYEGSNNFTQVKHLVYSAKYRVFNNGSYYIIIEYKTIGQATKLLTLTL